MPKIKKICVVCGKPFEVYPSGSGIQCCSRKCGAALRTMHGKRKLKVWNQESKKECFYQQFHLHFSRYVIL